MIKKNFFKLKLLFVFLGGLLVLYSLFSQNWPSIKTARADYPCLNPGSCEGDCGTCKKCGSDGYCYADDSCSCSSCSLGCGKTGTCNGGSCPDNGATSCKCFGGSCVVSTFWCEPSCPSDCSGESASCTVECPRCPSGNSVTCCEGGPAPTSTPTPSGPSPTLRPPTPEPPTPSPGSTFTIQGLRLCYPGSGAVCPGDCGCPAGASITLDPGAYGGIAPVECPGIPNSYCFFNVPYGTHTVTIQTVSGFNQSYSSCHDCTSHSFWVSSTTDTFTKTSGSYYDLWWGFEPIPTSTPTITPTPTPTSTPTPTPTPGPDASVQGTVRAECKSDQRWKAQPCNAGLGTCVFPGQNCEGCLGDCNVAPSLKIQCKKTPGGLASDARWGCGPGVEGEAFYITDEKYYQNQGVECEISNLPTNYETVRWDYSYRDAFGVEHPTQSGTCSGTTCTAAITTLLGVGAENYLHFTLVPEFTIQGYIGWDFGLGQDYDCPMGTKVILDGTTDTTNDPYSFSSVSGGNHTVSLQLPATASYYDVYYHPCDGCTSTTGHTNFGNYTKGSTYSFFNCDHDNYDLYWACVPQVFGKWFQTEDGDVHAQTDINSQIPPTATDGYLSRVGANDPGVISYGNSVSLGDGYLSTKDWQAKTPYQGSEKFEYFKSLLKVSPGSTPDLTCSLGICDIPPSGTYYHDGDIQLKGGAIGLGSKVIVSVHGNVRVLGNIIVAPTGFFALISSGNITFSGTPLVTQAQGFFSADGTLTVEDGGGTTDQFVGQGNFIGWGGISLQRDLDDGNNTTPASFFESRPDFYIYAPQEIKVVPFSFEELAP